MENSPKTFMLTPKQHALLTFIADQIAATGVCPNFDEMREAVGLKSKSGVFQLVSALEERGFIRRLPNRARALEIIKHPVPQPSLPQNISGDNVIRGGNLEDVLGVHQGEETVKLSIRGNIAAGMPLEVFETEGDVVDIPKNMLGPSPILEDYFALKIVGNSMIEAGIIDGDVVVLKKTSSAKEGAIVAALVDHDEVTLKRFFVRGEQIILEAANKDYLPQIYSVERVKIIGKLVNLMRRYE